MGEENCESFEEREDHPIEYHLKYKEYCSMIELQLEQFLVAKGLTQSDLMEYCELMREYDTTILLCVDYLLASLEYEDFYYLMLECRNLRGWVEPHDEEIES